MNLHLFQDEKYVDYFIEKTTSLGVEGQKYVVYTPHKQAHPKYVKSKEIHFCQFNSPEFHQAVGQVNQYEKIYIHYLSTYMAEFVNSLPKTSRIVWIFWGADGLETLRVFSNQSLYQHKTQVLYENWKLKNRLHFKEIWKWLKKETKGYLLYKNHIKAARRVNYIATLIPEDYELIRKKHNLRGQYVSFFYTTARQMVPVDLNVKGDNIFLGNSASFTNNHLEILEKLAALPLKNRKVLCPLSYGIEEYKQLILEKGKQLLNHNFYPLTEFLDRDAYYEYLESASVAIMNHNRQQALGNIIAFIMSGAKIFMSEESTLFHYLRRNGLLLYSVQHDFLPENDGVLAPLSPEAIHQNRIIIGNLLGEDPGKATYLNLLTL